MSGSSCEEQINAARSTSATHGSFPEGPVDQNLLPFWLNPNAIKAGREFIRRHFVLIIFTHFISLILLLSYIPVRTMLVRTRKSHTKDLALNRYMSTLRHIKLWYESDLTTPDSEGVRDVLKVRKIHDGVAKRVLQGRDMRNGSDVACINLNRNKCEKSLKSHPKIAGSKNSEVCSVRYISSESTSLPIISQLDMIVTQYCFMGLLTDFPDKFGISVKDTREVEGLEGFVHIWAVVGKLLGIDDRFNLCLSKNSQLKEIVLHEILLKDFSILKSDTIVLWESLVAAMSTFVPCLSINATLLYMLEYVLNFSVQEMYIKSSLYDKICYKTYIVVFNIIFKVSKIREGVNNALRFGIFVVSLKLGLLKTVIIGQ